MARDPETHWQRIYGKWADDQLPWIQPTPRCSLDLIRDAGLPPSAAIVDVGGGSSALVDHLLAEGFRNLTVLDVAPAALDRAKARLGQLAEQVAWVHADIRFWQPSRTYDLWHDRAVFHFLIDAEDQAAYLRALEAALSPRGIVVLGAFSAKGPDTCAGLPVRRLADEVLGDLLGAEFELLRIAHEDHVTCAGVTQRFVWGMWKRIG